MTHAFGLDIGGTGTKGAVVDVTSGELRSERVRLDTPQPATIEAVLATAAEVVARVGWAGPVGCAFPGIIKRGIVGSAANIDAGWIGQDLSARLAERLGQPVATLNDADAAGLAEIELGAGRGISGVVMVLTLGTGIGSALFIDGTLVPNTELGHLQLDGVAAELRASAAARQRDGLSYAQWAERLQRYFDHLERVFAPDRFIIGGGISRNAEQFVPLISTTAPITVAALRQNAGIVGAALSSPSGGPRSSH